MISKKQFWAICAPLLLAACNSGEQSVASNEGVEKQDTLASISPVDKDPFVVEDVAQFDQPWAMAFMPGTPLLFVTEMQGSIKFVDTATGTSRRANTGCC